MQYPGYLDVLGSLPLEEGGLRRISITTRCNDCRDIPKQPGAGSVRDTSPWPVQVMHNGVLVARDGYYGPWMTRIIEQLAGHHEPQEELVFHEILASLPDATTMLELGAYWAYYSLWFLNRFPHGRTILVEPDPNCLAIGEYNYALNGRTGRFIQAAVADRPGAPATFLCNTDGVARQVPRVSVDSLVEQEGCDRIDVLLADIQGAELAMLEGAQETLRRGRLSALIVSTHDRTISGDFLTHDTCLAWIRDHGGRIIAEHSVEESFSGDGLIAAAFDDRCPITVAVSRNRAVDSLFGHPAARLADMEQRLAQSDDARRLAAEDATTTAAHARRRLDRLRRRRRTQAIEVARSFTAKDSGISVYFLGLYGLLELVTGLIHFALPDGGAGLIAGLDLTQNKHTIIGVFAWMGALQIAYGLGILTVACWYRPLAPLFLALALVERVLMSVAAWVTKPSPTGHHPPEHYASLLLVPVLTVVLAMTLRSRAKN